MKNFYFWMLALFCSTLAFSQLSEDFESDVTANGWAHFATSDEDPGFVLTTTEAYSGNSSYFHNDDNLTSGESTAYLVSPAYTVQAGDEFSVYVRQNYSTTYYNYSGILISTASGDPIANPSDFEELQELGEDFAEDEWVQVIIDISSHVGETVYFAFQYTGDYEHEFYIDNLLVGEQCENPTANFSTTDMCASNEFSIQAEITDLGSATSITISDNQGNLQTVSATGTYTVGTYTGGTEVTVIVANDENSSCAVQETLTVLCPPSNDNCDTAESIASFPFTNTVNASAATQTDFVTCDGNGMNDGVWYTFEGASSEFTISVSPTSWDAEIAVYSGTCTTLACVARVDDATVGGEETLTFIGQEGVTYYVNIGHRSATADEPEGIFDIEITSEEIPCGSPSNLSVQAVTDLSANASWQANAENESYDLIWGPAGFTPSTDPNAEGITATTYEITGLTPDTDYDLYVRGNCNPGYSTWVGPVSFTTLEEGAILAGTDCAHPITVASLPYSTTDNTSNYGDDYDGGQGSNCGSNSQYYLGGDDVVYVYTPSADTSIDISLSPEGTYSGIFVYEDCNDIGVNCIAGAASSNTNERIIDNLIVTGGQSYFIVISTWPAPQSIPYTLEITENTCIDIEYSLEAVGDCDNSQYTVEVEISSLGSSSNLEVSDDQGSATQTITEPGTLTFGPYPDLSSVTFGFTPDDANCFQETTFSFACPAVNNNCVDAQELMVGENFEENATLGSNIGASSDENMPAPGCAYYQGGEVWYTTMVPETGHIIIETNSDAGSSIVDAGLAVYSGSCDELTLVECDDDDSLDGAFSLIELNNRTPGEILYIAVWEYGNDTTGTFRVSAYDDLTCIPTQYTVEEEIDCDAGTYTVTFNFTSIGDASSVTLTDDQGSDAQTISEAGTLTFGPYPAATTIVFSGDTGDPNCAFSETVFERCTGVGEVCENSIIVDSLPYSTDDTTANYYDDYTGGQGSNCGSTSQYYLNGDDVVYSYTPTTDTSIDITLTPMGTWSGIFVYESCEDIGVNCIAGAANAGSDVRNIDDLAVVGGQTYYILISTWAAPQSVEYNLQITENSCVNAEFELEAIQDCDNGEFSVNINVTSLGSSSNLDVTDNQGSATQSLSEPGMLTFGPYADSTEVVFSFTPDDANCNEEVNFTSVCPAVNDACEDAQELLVGATFQDNAVIGNNIGATDSGIEAPTCGLYEGGDVWYSFVVPASGHVIVETYYADATQTNFDTAVAIYSGTCDGTLTQIECDDDGAAVGNFSFIERDDLTPGETILVRVWEFSQDNFGTFAISVYDDQTCVAPEYTVTTECDGTGSFTVQYDFTSLGSASSITLADDQGSEAQTITEAGTLTFGPYAESTEVLISGDTGDVNCAFSDDFAGICPPANDECDESIDIAVEMEVVDAPTMWTPGTVAGATDSGIAAPSCDGFTGTANDDVWYSFTATASEISITLEDNFDGVVELFEGDCGNLVSITCADVGAEPQIDAMDLTVGVTYYVRVFNYSASAPTDPTFNIAIWSTSSMGVNDIANNRKVMLYPNPTSDVLNISGMVIKDVQVYSISGQLVKVKTTNNTVDTKQLPTGTYIIRMIDNEGNVVQKKFIKK